jgi:hypothetical protein
MAAVAASALRMRVAAQPSTERRISSARAFTSGSIRARMVAVLDIAEGV